MPPKRDVSTQNLPWLPSTDLRLNTETNILEPIVNMWGYCKKRPYGLSQDMLLSVAIYVCQRHASALAGKNLK